MTNPDDERCTICGEPFDDMSPSVEAFEMTGELVCHGCADEALSERDE